MRVDYEAANDVPDDEVLWDVFDEHLDELESCVSRLQRAQEHPLMRLRELARNAEARLRAHLDALVVAGPEAARAVARRLAEELDPEEPARTTAVALALTTTGLDELVAPFFGHEEPRVRLAAVRGCRLSCTLGGQTLVSPSLSTTIMPLPACNRLTASMLRR